MNNMEAAQKISTELLTTSIAMINEKYYCPIRKG